MGGHVVALPVAEDDQLPFVVPGVDRAVPADGDGVGLHAAEVQVLHEPAGLQRPALDGPVVAGADDLPAVVAPPHRDDVGLVPAEDVEQVTGEVEDPDAVVAGGGGHLLLGGVEGGHLHVVLVVAEHRAQPHVGDRPDAGAVVAGGGHQESAVGAEGALVGEVIVGHPGERDAGALVPEDDVVVVPGGGDVGVLVGGDAADGAGVADHGEGSLRWALAGSYGENTWCLGGRNGEVSSGGRPVRHFPFSVDKRRPPPGNPSGAARGCAARPAAISLFPDRRTRAAGNSR